MLTAGLKCAPEIGPKVRISTARIAPVGSVLQSSASAPLPPDELGGHDAGADHGRQQKGGARAFSDHALREWRHHVGSAAFAVAPACGRFLSASLCRLN